MVTGNETLCIYLSCSVPVIMVRKVYAQALCVLVPFCRTNHRQPTQPFCAAVCAVVGRDRGVTVVVMHTCVVKASLRKKAFHYSHNYP